jgi:hypothetical protein
MTRLLRDLLVVHIVGVLGDNVWEALIDNMLNIGVPKSLNKQTAATT